MTKIFKPDQRETFTDRCFKDYEGKLALGAPANLPIIVAVISALGIFIPFEVGKTIAIVIAYGAMFTWAWLELFDGINYFRRALGAFTLIGIIAIITIYMV